MWRRERSGARPTKPAAALTTSCSAMPAPSRRCSRPIVADACRTLSADRPERHRQGDAGLPDGALCARPPGPGGAGGRRGNSLAIDRSIPWRAAWPHKGTAIFLSSNARQTTKACCASKSPSRTCAARCRFSARPQARAAGASPSSTRSMNSTAPAPMPCSRFWRSRRSARCCSWCATRRRACWRRCAHAAPCCRCGRLRSRCRQRACSCRRLACR